MERMNDISSAENLEHGIRGQRALQEYWSDVHAEKDRGMIE